MKRLLLAAALFLLPFSANAGPLSSPCTQSGPNAVECDPVNSSNPLPTNRTSLYPVGATAITGNATGTTGAVVGTLAGTSGKTTYVCGLAVSAIGGTATIGPITVAGTVTGSMVFQLASTAAGNTLVVPFSPCVPASAANTAITTTTTADGTASAVDVNSWGYQQ
jgi:hypothetical protein